MRDKGQGKRRKKEEGGRWKKGVAEREVRKETEMNGWRENRKGWKKENWDWEGDEKWKREEKKESCMQRKKVNMI